MGHRDVQLLSDDPAVDLLVHHHTDGSLVHVEHHAGSAVVVLERHALVNGRVDLDVDIVTSLLGGSMAKFEYVIDMVIIIV